MQKSMTDKGLVSIITPTYNCGKYIEETLQSVLAQTYRNWEMIIVDDFSTDNTAEIVAQYISIDSRIRYYRNSRNEGAALTRNRAIREAHGKWISFLDSDDLWKPEKLECQLDFMIENDYAFTYHKYEEIDENSHPLGITVSGLKRVKRLNMMTCCWPGCLSAIYNAEKIGLVQIPDIKKNNDQAMWMEIVKKADCFFIDTTLASYRRRKGSITPNRIKDKLYWHFILCRKCGHYSTMAAAVLTLLSIPANARKKIFYIKKEKDKCR